MITGKELPQLFSYEEHLLQSNCHVRNYAHDMANTLSALHQSKELLDIVILVIQEGDEFWTLDAAKTIRGSYDLPILFIIDTINSDAIEHEIRQNRYACWIKYKPHRKFLTAAEDAFQNLLPESRQVSFQNKSYYFLKEAFFFKSRNKLEKVSFDDIRYIQENASEVELISTSEKYVLKLSQGAIARLIQKPYFVYCHQSILVNIKLVDSFSSKLLVSGDYKIPIQNPYKDQVFNMFRIFDHYKT